MVTTLMIAALALAVLCMGKLWLEARSELAELRIRLAYLKRRLKLTER